MVQTSMLSSNTLSLGLPWKLFLGFGGLIDSGRTESGRQFESERAGRQWTESGRRIDLELAGRRRFESGPHRIERGRPLVYVEAVVVGQQKDAELGDVVVRL